MTRLFQAAVVLGIGLVMTMVLFPWLDHVRDTTYHPTIPVLKVGTDGPGTTDVMVDETRWASQLVTVTGYRMDRVDLLVWRESSPGTIGVSLRKDSPTGAEVASGNGAVYTEMPQWAQLRVEADLEPGTYAVVVHATGSVGWRVQSGEGLSISEDGGATWA